MGKRKSGVSLPQVCVHWMFSKLLDHRVVTAARKVDRLLEDIRAEPRMAGPRSV